MLVPASTSAAPVRHESRSRSVSDTFALPRPAVTSVLTSSVKCRSEPDVSERSPDDARRTLASSISQPFRSDGPPASRASCRQRSTAATTRTLLIVRLLAVADPHRSFGDVLDARLAESAVANVVDLPSEVRCARHETVDDLLLLKRFDDERRVRLGIDWCRGKVDRRHSTRPVASAGHDGGRSRRADDARAYCPAATAPKRGSRTHATVMPMTHMSPQQRTLDRRSARERRPSIRSARQHGEGLLRERQAADVDPKSKLLASRKISIKDGRRRSAPDAVAQVAGLVRDQLAVPDEEHRAGAEIDLVKVVLSSKALDLRRK